MNLKSLILLLISCVSFAQKSDFPTLKVDSIVNRIQLPVFSDYQVNVAKLGAKGDSVTNNKAVLIKQWLYAKRKAAEPSLCPKESIK